MSDYETLKKLIDEIDVLISSRITSDDPDFISWKTKVDRFLKKKYGGDSEERLKFSKISFIPIILSFDDEDDFDMTSIDSCKSGLESAKAVLSVYLEEISEEIKEREESSTPQTKQKDKFNDFSNVFIVHGHDGELKEAVARLIESQGIKTIILNEQTNQGRTIIEKLEGYSNVGGAICLFTPDDVGSQNGDSNMKCRARQNVVFEAGYFMGKLGRDKVVIIAKGEMELPSDMSGIVYTNEGEWKYKILKELKAMGYKIDLNLL